MLCWLIAIWLGTIFPGIEGVSPGTPHAIKRQSPKYPEDALRRDMAGDTIVRVRIDSAGRVLGTSLVEEAPEGYEFGSAAVECVNGWMFASDAPGTFDLTIRFRLESERHIDRPEKDYPPAPTPVRIKPAIWPDLAVIKRMQGKVELLVNIERGSLTGIGVIREGKTDGSGSSLFGDAALRAVWRWKFASDVDGLYIVTLPFDAASIAAGLTEIED